MAAKIGVAEVIRWFLTPIDLDQLAILEHPTAAGAINQDID
jgi:hypothetical protein